MELLDSDRFEGAITGMHLLRISLILAKRQPSQIAIPNVQERTKQMIELLQLCMRETPVQVSDTSGNKGVPQVRPSISCHDSFGLLIRHMNLVDLPSSFGYPKVSAQ